jgi:hypothetical protein
VPTLEIISFEAIALNINKNDFEFNIIEENLLKSHRKLFYNYLRKKKGIILHLGNPNQKNEDFCFANHLLSPNIITEDPLKKDKDEIYFQFNEKYKKDIELLLKIALKYSPIGKACILTDYQFSPESRKLINIKTLMGFWHEHDENALVYNTLYKFKYK